MPDMPFEEMMRYLRAFHREHAEADKYSAAIEQAIKLLEEMHRD